MQKPSSTTRNIAASLVLVSTSLFASATLGRAIAAAVHSNCCASIWPSVVSFSVVAATVALFKPRPSGRFLLLLLSSLSSFFTVAALILAAVDQETLGVRAGVAVVGFASAGILCWLYLLRTAFWPPPAA